MCLTLYRNFDKAIWTEVFGSFKLGAKIDESICDLCFKAATSEFAKEGAVVAPFLVKGFPTLLTTTSNKGNQLQQLRRRQSRL